MMVVPVWSLSPMTLYSENSGRCGAATVVKGTDITLVSYGTMIGEVLHAAELLKEKGISAEVIKLNTVIPIDYDTIAESVRRTWKLLIAEECVAMSSVGQQTAAWLAEHGCAPGKLVLCNLGNDFVTHGTVTKLRQYMGIDGESIARKAMEVC